MDRPPRDQTALRAASLQGRAFHFLRKLALHARRRPTDPVAIPTQDFHRAHSSVDLVRKQGISPLVGFRVEDGPSPMDTDDSSQDASASGNPPRSRRRHSTLDSQTAPFHATLAVRGPASAFARDPGGLGNGSLLDDAANVLAPPPPSSQSSTSLGAPMQPFRSPMTNPKIPRQISASPESKPGEEAVQHTMNDGTLRPLGHVVYHDALTAPLTDPTPSTSAYPGIFPGAKSVPEAQRSAETNQERPPLPHSHTTPLPPPFRVTTERGLRLSPSIISRQPIPLLNLPPLPPPSSVPDMPSRPRVPLRSMPSLSRHGRSNIKCQADHENATLGDSDEDDGDEGDEEEEPPGTLNVQQSDDEDDEPLSAGTFSSQGFESLQNQSVRDGENPVKNPVPSTPAQGDSVRPIVDDHSCSKIYVQPVRLAPSSTSLAMYPFSPNIPGSEDVNQRRALDPDLQIPGTRSENRPRLYHAASRSMINLGPSRLPEGGLRPHNSMELGRASAGSTSGNASGSVVGSEDSESEAVIERFLRRASMPSYRPTSDPPPYPTFNPRPRESRVISHENEEWELLPSYSNSLYLIAVMPRKMEFSCPGVQAKDRKWRRVVCELEGTTFRVYKCPPGASGAGVLGDWWEKHVGVGDVASPNTPRTRRKEEQVEWPAKLGVDRPSALATSPVSSGRSTSVPPIGHNRRRSGSQSSMATQNTTAFTPRSAKRASGASFLSPFRSSSAARPEANAGETSRPRESRELELLPVDAQSSHSSLSQEASGQATPPAQGSSLPPQPRSATRLSFLPMATGRVQWRNDEISKPVKSDLIRAYTLQHAESGLGNDYLKRKNVIRVRLEGEQFLLQAPDVPAVVEWIEGLHAGTNIALDIDERPMPRGPMFPRRRRRRARRGQGEDAPGARPSAPRIAR